MKMNAMYDVPREVSKPFHYEPYFMYFSEQNYNEYGMSVRYTLWNQSNESKQFCAYSVLKVSAKKSTNASKGLE